MKICILWNTEGHNFQRFTSEIHLLKGAEEGEYQVLLASNYPLTTFIFPLILAVAASFGNDIRAVFLEFDANDTQYF